jgi:hypothetical protein
MARQELTGGQETDRPCKPHLEQGQIEGLWESPARPRVGRMSRMATSGLDRWSLSPDFSGDTELGLQVYLAKQSLFVICFLLPGRLSIWSRHASKL